MQPGNWKKLKRHPLSEAYGDLKPRARERMRAGLLKWGILNGRKITLHEGMVLDAWQLYSLCVEEGIPPEFQPLPDGMDPAEWVELMNDTRRHEPEEVVEARVTARRDRVVEARLNGQSLPTIAEEEGISIATVRRDLDSAASGLPGGKPEPPAGKVTGSDGKTYPASKPVILCLRCQRLGSPVAGCNACKQLRKDKADEKRKAKIKAKAEASPIADAYGTAIPKGRLDAWSDPWIQATLDTLTGLAVEFRKHRFATGMDKRKKHYPFFIPKDFIDGVGMIDNTLDLLIKHLEEQRPAGVCPRCAGKGCPHCRQAGLVPRSVYEQLQEAAT